MGKRGEGWFLLQMILFGLILLSLLVERRSFSPVVRGLGLAALALGGVFGTLGLLSLGRNLSPFPKPIEGGQLVQTGAYRFVRHPIYAGLILGTLGFALLWSSLLGIGMAVVLFTFFDLKSRREEVWLGEAYPEYAEYKTKVKKLIPGVY